MSLTPRPPKKDSIISLHRSPSNLHPDYLRTQARWIRDILDPQVATEGPDALHSDEILTLDELLRTLLESSSSLPLADIRYSRMHLAISEICGRATRWPKKLIERGDALKTVWEARFGVGLRKLGTPLYEEGGRLWGICRPEDLSKERLLVRWLRSPEAKLSPAVARRTGDLGFVPGDWWISALFAHRAGIIDSPNSEGGIVCDSNGAYAVVMTDGDEVAGSDPSSFQYRARDKDMGRYRLTAATPESRHPIRILRTHTLHSFWKPRAGIRYDGLHKVSSWCIRKDPKSNEFIYLITFKRLPTELSMDDVLCRPWSDEVEDYSEYKRLRQMHKEQQKDPDKPVLKPTLTISADGAEERVVEVPDEAEVEERPVFRPTRWDEPRTPKGRKILGERTSNR